MNEKKIAAFYRKRNVLIPGGAGFIGSNLARKLVGLGAKVTVVDPLDRVCGSNPFNIKDIEKKIILVKQKIERFVSRNSIKQFRVIFNCVGLADHHLGLQKPSVDYAINCESGLRLLEKLAKEKATCRMISIGSRGQYGKPDSVHIDESCPMNPLDIQAVHKVALERYHSIFAASYGLDLSYVRLTNVYGPGQKLRGTGIGAIGEIIKESVSGNEVIIYGGLSRIKDILYIDDVVSALLLLGMSDEGGFRAYNLGGQGHALASVLSAIRRYIPAAARIIPFSDMLKKIDTGDVVLDAGRIRNATDWSAKVGLEEGVRTTLMFYRQYGRYYL